MHLRIRFTSFRNDEGLKGPWSTTFTFPDDVQGADGFDFITFVRTGNTRRIVGDAILPYPLRYEIQRANSADFETTPTTTTSILVYSLAITAPSIFSSGRTYVRVRRVYNLGSHRNLFGPWSNTVDYTTATAADTVPSTPPDPFDLQFLQSTASTCRIQANTTLYRYYAHFQIADDTSGTNVVNLYDNTLGEEHFMTRSVTQIRGKYVRVRFTTLSSGRGTASSWSSWYLQIPDRADFPIPDLIFEQKRPYGTEAVPAPYASVGPPHRRDRVLQLQSSIDGSFTDSPTFHGTFFNSNTRSLVATMANFKTRSWRARYASGYVTGGAWGKAPSSDVQTLEYGRWSPAITFDQAVDWIPQATGYEIVMQDATAVEPSIYKWCMHMQFGSDPDFLGSVSNVYKNTRQEIHIRNTNFTIGGFPGPDPTYARIRFTEGANGTGDAGPWSKVRQWPEVRNDMPVPDLTVSGQIVHFRNPDESRRYRLVVQTSTTADFSGTVTDVSTHVSLGGIPAYDYSSIHAGVYVRAAFSSAEWPIIRNFKFRGPWSSIVQVPAASAVPAWPQNSANVPSVNRILNQTVAFDGVNFRTNLQVQFSTNSDFTSPVQNVNSSGLVVTIPDAYLRLGQFYMRARYHENGSWSTGQLVDMRNHAVLHRPRNFRAAFVSARTAQAVKTTTVTVQIATHDLNDGYDALHVQASLSPDFSTLLRNAIIRTNFEVSSGAGIAISTITLVANDITGPVHVRSRFTLMGSDQAPAIWNDTNDSNRIFGPWSDVILLTDYMPRPVLRYDPTTQLLSVTSNPTLTHPVFLTLNGHITPATPVISRHRATFNRPNTSFLLHRSEIPWSGVVDGSQLDTVAVHARFTTQVNDEGNPGPWSDSAYITP